MSITNDRLRVIRTNNAIGNDALDVCGQESLILDVSHGGLYIGKENNDGYPDIIATGPIIEILYDELVNLRDNSKLIPGQQYRITNYITTTTQKDTISAGHQFDIIVTAINSYTLSEDAKAIQNDADGYFDDYNLEAWELKYCIDNDINRFAWAGNKTIVHTYDSSTCTINSELINGNEFITPFNFESCIWVDVDNDNDGIAYGVGDQSNHDLAELIYEWGYFTDADNNTQLCLYKSDAGLYEEEGHPDYGDKYLYRGVTIIDGEDYDYWQKWDAGDNGVYINGGDAVFATTPRIVSNPNNFVHEIITDVESNYKGIIYYMKDEFGNECPYDFKNIMFYKSLPNIVIPGFKYDEYYYTFTWIDDNGNITDMTLTGQYLTNDEGYCPGVYDNKISNCSAHVLYLDGKTEPFLLALSNNVFIYTHEHDGGLFWGCYGNVLSIECYNNTFGNDCYKNTFENYCSNNTFGNGCSFNTFGNNCSNNTFRSHCSHNTFRGEIGNNTFGDGCSFNTFVNNCQYNTFMDGCSSNTFNSCYNNTFANGCSNNTFKGQCKNNRFGQYCKFNTFADYCQSNTFGTDCHDNAFGTQCFSNTFEDFCQSNTFGTNCHDNAFRHNCQKNTFGNSCYSNTFGDFCYGNTFGNSCYSNTFGPDCYNNTFRDECISNRFGEGCTDNTFGNSYSSNTFGDFCYGNTFGNSCYSNTFGNCYYSNTFGNFCHNNTFGNTYKTGGHYYRYFVLGDGTQYIIFKNTDTASFNNCVQNYRTAQGLQGTANNKLIVDVTRGLSYETTIAFDTKGNIKQYVESELGIEVEFL